MPKTAI